MSIDSPEHGWIRGHPLAALGLVAVASGGLVFAFMTWSKQDQSGPQPKERDRLQIRTATRPTGPLNGAPAKGAALRDSADKDNTIADLESKVRALEQRLSLSKTQEQIAQVSLAEQRKAKQDADKLVAEQTPQINTLKQQLAELTQNLSTNNAATLSKEELDRLASQVARQRARFNVNAHRIWRKWFDVAVNEVDRDTARFVGKLEKGMAYNEAVAEFSKLKANNDRFIEFADGNAVVLANLLVLIENEMWKRFTDSAFNDEARTTFSSAIAADLKPVSEWDALLNNAPDRGQRTVQEWLRDLTTLQQKFAAEHFDSRSNVNR